LQVGSVIFIFHSLEIIAGKLEIVHVARGTSFLNEIRVYDDPPF